jgi:hypothetical protein
VPWPHRVAYLMVLSVGHSAPRISCSCAIPLTNRDRLRAGLDLILDRELLMRDYKGKEADRAGTSACPTIGSLLRPFSWTSSAAGSASQMKPNFFRI